MTLLPPCGLYPWCGSTFFVHILLQFHRKSPKSYFFCKKQGYFIDILK